MNEEIIISCAVCAIPLLGTIILAVCALLSDEQPNETNDLWLTWTFAKVLLSPSRARTRYISSRESNCIILLQTEYVSKLQSFSSHTTERGHLRTRTRKDRRTTRERFWHFCRAIFPNFCRTSRAILCYSVYFSYRVYWIINEYFTYIRICAYIYVHV